MNSSIATHRSGSPRLFTRRLPREYVLGSVMVLIVVGTTAAQTEKPEAIEAQQALQHDAEVPSVSLVRTEVPPVIDGVMDEPLWEDAAVIENLTQVEPKEGAEPTQRTEIRIVYDSDSLYVGVRAFDSEPEKIIANQLLRDAPLGDDDRVAIIIDPYFDHRNGFLFGVNPLGSRRDALIENNGRRTVFDWDGIWYAKATIDDEGWTAEFAVPYKTISFNKDTTRWGFNIIRVIRRDNEVIRWSSARQNLRTTSISTIGVIEDIKDITQGAGLDFVPYVKGTIRDDDERGTGNDFDAGFDLFYKLTPSMNLAFTVNTDFAETEVDDRQVNLTRFPLFFPEKRDFFLQDAGIFEFAGISRNPIPFFSRRIGLDKAGRPVDLIAGAKLTGRAGALNLGIQSVYQDDFQDVDEQLLTVGRVSLNVLEESTVGLITTIGDPTSNDDNYIVGGDFNFRNSKVFGDKVVTSNLFFLHSSSPDTVGDDQSWGATATLRYPKDRINASIGFKEIGERYNAALGFVPRRGIREYAGLFRYRWRPEKSWIRTIDTQVTPVVITNLDNDIETQITGFDFVTIESNEGDRIGLNLSLNREVLDAPFEIRPGVIIPVDDYRFERYGAEFSTSGSRALSFAAAVEAGDFFDGDRFDTALGVELRPSPHLFLGLSWEYNDVDLPEGDFDVHIARARVRFMFTPDLSWTNFIQWDNVSKSMGINSRVRWIVEPGSEIFFVVNQAFDTEGSRFDSTFTEFTSKVGWTFRF